MNILHITCSPRQAGSHSVNFSARIVERLRQLHPQAQVTVRDLAADPLPHVDGHYAYALGGAQSPVASAGSLARSDALIGELQSADAIVIGTPMHNFTVPSNLKAWIDHVLRIHRTFEPTPEGKRGLLRDRPVYIAVASGGLFRGDEARQPDFLTPYLSAVMTTMGLRLLYYFTLQGMVRDAQSVAAEWRKALAALDLQLPPAALAA